MRWIYISPHLDDAILSAGGLIFDQVHQGQPVEIWTVMCGFPEEGKLSPFAQFLHAQWGFSSTAETVRLRRLEDRRAADRVGAQVFHLDIPDCIYRRSPEGEPLYPIGVFVDPHPADSDLPRQITDRLQAGLTPEDVVVCPLAIGGHVDHILTRKGVEGLKRRIWYYADVPYVLNEPGALSLLEGSYRSQRFSISPEGMIAWLEAVEAYRSQLSTLFQDVDSMRRSIREYGEQGVRLWMQQAGRFSS